MTPEEHIELIRAYKRVFASPDGALVLADLKKHSTFARSAILPSGFIDPNRLIKDEAQRGFVLYIIDQTEVDLEAEPITQTVNTETGKD